MANVPADRDFQPIDPPEADLQGERIEQGLGRMLVGAVAGIDHGAIRQLGEAGRGAVLTVADDDAVRAHCVQRPRGIVERLALLDRRLLDGEEHGRGA